MTGPIRRWRSMRTALTLLGGHCSRDYTGRTHCWDRPNLSPHCPYLADRWCEGCIADAGLRGLAFSRYPFEEVS